ncbi:hypothetical protein RFI_35543 [Reticulomyxa filosa]|uniref:Uncharacterized protein n=1 Tax=Reticulomyxa filosa TaxID=46433 RepID=X6LKN3_RETFI|nr:hypothetical protein RFI_35543 [Reticulomyxa filosa]|eukprot:ETO01896.1 hypothetical protein RFI_35543 [Reticulomyxa filosa]
MDLGTINEKMKRVEYTNAEMFAKDVRPSVEEFFDFQHSRISALFFDKETLRTEMMLYMLYVHPHVHSFVPFCLVCVDSQFERSAVDSANKADGSYRERLTQLVELMYELNSIDMGKLINIVEMKCPFVLNDFIDKEDKINNPEEECLDIEIINIPISICTELIDFCQACIANYPQNSSTNINTIAANTKTVDNAPPLMTTPAVQIKQDQPPEQRVKEEIKPEPKMFESSGNQHENNPIHNIGTIKNE